MEKALTAQQVLEKSGFIIIEGNQEREVGKAHTVHQGYGLVPDGIQVFITHEISRDEAVPLLRSWGWGMPTRKHIYKAVAE